MDIPTYDQKAIRSLIDKANTAYNFGRWKEAFGLFNFLESLISKFGIYPGAGHVYYRVGFIYNRGHYVKKNPEKAAHYFKLAISLLRFDAENGDPEAQCDLAFMYNVGDGIEMNKETAFSYYFKAAESGYDRGQYNLGFMYSNGLGVKKDKEIAAKYYQLAADQGHTWAQNNLGLLYDIGEGVICNKQTAVKYYQLSAEQQHASAQNNLGLMYEKGEGVVKDYEKAALYYRLALENGNASAQYNLARFYEKGTTTIKQDQNIAIRYFFEAAIKGQSEAREHVKQILSGCKSKNTFSIDYKTSCFIFAGQHWPETHHLLHVNCQKVILDVFVLLRDKKPIEDLPVEMIIQVVQAIAMTWPIWKDDK